MHFRKDLTEDGIEIIRVLTTLAEFPKGFEGLCHFFPFLDLTHSLVENFLSGVVSKLIPLFGVKETTGS